MVSKHSIEQSRLVIKAPRCKQVVAYGTHDTEVDKLARHTRHSFYDGLVIYNVLVKSLSQQMMWQIISLSRMAPRECHTLAAC